MNTNNIEAFVHYLAVEMAQDIKLDLKKAHSTRTPDLLNMSKNSIKFIENYLKEYLTEQHEKKGAFDKIDNIEKMNVRDIIEIKHDVETIIHKVAKKVSKEASKNITRKRVESKTKKEFIQKLEESVAKRDIFLRALEKTKFAQKYPTLQDEKLLKIAIEYEEAKSSLVDYKTISKKMASQEKFSAGSADQRELRAVENKVGNAFSHWNALNPREKKNLMEVGLTEENFKELQKPFFKERSHTLGKLHKEINELLDKFDKGELPSTEKGKVSIKLQNFVSLSRSDTGKEYLEKHAKEYKQVTERAKSKKFKYNDQGDEHLV